MKPSSSRTLCLLGILLFAFHPMKAQEHAFAAGDVLDILTVEAFGDSTFFTSQPISDAVFTRMKGHSYPESCPIALSNLRYLHVLHCDIDGHTHVGELVVNKAIAGDVLEILLALYRAHYPIERMQLIDDFDADDERSMSANNSSAFCCRTVSGSSRLSKHALGMAIDINPLYNPYYRVRRDGSALIQPATGAPYVNRALEFPYKITRNDLCHRLFLAHGFRWGGAWSSIKDYQHFEK